MFMAAPQPLEGYQDDHDVADNGMALMEVDGKFRVRHCNVMSILIVLLLRRSPT